MADTLTSPSPITWTLRLKHHRTTILLHVNQLQTFSSIKRQLLAILQETQTDGQLNGLPLPSSPSDIIFGRAVDINDPSGGFRLGEWERSVDDLEDEEDGKGKGKAVVKGKGRPKKDATEDVAESDSVKECVKGAGLKDGAVLAFKWRTAVEDDEDELATGDTEWDVIIPSYEDSYGVENIGDVGGSKPFEG